MDPVLRGMAPARRGLRSAQRTARYFHGALLAKPPDRDQLVVAWGFVAAVIWGAVTLATGDRLPLRTDLFFALAGLLAAIAAIDARWGLIPDELVAGIAVIGTLALCQGLPLPTWVSRLAAAAGLLALGLVSRSLAEAWFRRDALGSGDVKLVAAAVLLVGLQGLLVLMPLALASALLALGLHWCKAAALPDTIPFGPHLGVALLWTVLLGATA